MIKMDLTDYALSKHILPTVVVLVDTREKENGHIISHLEKKNVKYEVRKLEYGDYGMKIPANPEKGIPHDLTLEYAIERKADLEELAGNLSSDRDRLERELWRGAGKMAAVIEDASIDMIMEHEYNTGYDEKAFIATIASFSHRYSVPFYFVSKKHSGKLILAMLLYKLREDLKTGE